MDAALLRKLARAINEEYGVETKVWKHPFNPDTLTLSVRASSAPDAGYHDVTDLASLGDALIAVDEAAGRPAK